MNTIKELSTENIRSRMIKNAARIWGVEGDDIESTFDPMVTMLIEACAFELYKVNNEIKNSQSRILERLAQVLSPDTFTGAQPAYPSGASLQTCSVLSLKQHKVNARKIKYKV